MLDALRRGAQGWLAKLLFAILIVSFGIFWNVSDVFRGYGGGAVAKVGQTEITDAEFQRAFQRTRDGLKLNDGSPITTEQALAFNVHRQVVNQLISEAAIQEHAKKLGLSLSNETLADMISKDPNFAGPDGRFSRLDFEARLRNANMSEQAFLADWRAYQLQGQILDAFKAAVVVPKPIVDELYAWGEETRTIEHVQIDPAKVTVADPDDAKLNETYEAHKTELMTPEYRKVAVLPLLVDTLKSEVKLTDDELKAYYTDHKSAYDKVERRRLQQIPFKDKAAAEAARKEIVDGKKNFLDAAKEAGATETDVNLGMLAKADMLDPVIADAAFALERDKLSDPIEGRFSTVLVRAIEIDPAKESTFDEVKDKVRDKLASERAETMLQERIDLVEEGRNAGKTLKEISEEQKIKFVEIEAVAADNKTPDGKTGLDIADAAIVLKEVFANGVGTQPAAVNLPGSGSVWFDVLGVTEAKQKPFESVKDDVKKLYVDKEKSKLLDELAKKLVERLRGGEAFEKVAADSGGKPEKLEQIKRNASPPGLTTDAVRQAFGLAKGGAGYAQTSDRGSRVVFQVKEIVAASPASKAQSDKLAQELSQELAEDQEVAYLTGLKAAFNAFVNEAELARATGSPTGNEQ
ncbi:peptidylprolyl isomerase [uncultured Hyphomicrobium sp.]|uniref:peptidylprolyl isomerase n=1 Tax=uncultured Hyphomicrobium sp. TaxID=194373 RepID=UPI0025FCFD84|nr:peptidylprolyl isomerase [uncultured Hyphomicrobium sp.]